VEGEPAPLGKRKITEETCRKWRYLVGEHKGTPCQIANYCDETGRVVAQKIRFPDKSFTWTGDPTKSGLYGQHLWRDGGKMVVVTEGEIDALSVSQLQENKWPVVSIPNGAAAAARDLGKSVEWLEKFESVVLMFDNDEPGQTAAIECASLLTPGKAKIAKLPLKDANDMLVAGRGREVIEAMWGAKAYRPDGIIGMDDVITQALKPVEWGVSWPWETLTRLTYGIRTKEIYCLGAGVGSGKTDVFTQIISHFITTHKEQVGVIYLEQAPPETAKRIAGKIAKKPFHVPDGGWTPEELSSSLHQLNGRVHFYNHFGSTDWNVIKGLIRYMALGLGIKRIFIDHLTALTAHAEDERRELDAIMADLGALCQNLDVSIFVISHLATPEGKPHEEGGRVMAKHFRGSRSIMQWSNFMFGLERNQQSEDEIKRRTTIFRVLKDRNTGRGSGKTLALLYDEQTGMLEETKMPEEFGFENETKAADRGAKKDF
jgi:twinkle protein